MLFFLFCLQQMSATARTVLRPRSVAPMGCGLKSALNAKNARSQEKAHMMWKIRQRVRQKQLLMGQNGIATIQKIQNASFLRAAAILELG